MALVLKEKIVGLVNLGKGVDMEKRLRLSRLRQGDFTPGDYERWRTRGIGCKQESVILYNAGFFGPVGKTWNSVNDYFEDTYEGPVLVRSQRGFGGGICKHDLDKSGVRNLVEKINPADKEGLWVNVAFPKDLALVQGEIMMRPCDRQFHPSLFCSFESGVHMRDALAGSSYSFGGFSAINILRDKMTQESYEDLKKIFDIFPTSVVETSVYDVLDLREWCGKSGNSRNAIFWEVRNY